MSTQLQLLQWESRDKKNKQDRSCLRFREVSEYLDYEKETGRKHKCMTKIRIVKMKMKELSSSIKHRLGQLRQHHLQKHRSNLRCSTKIKQKNHQTLNKLRIVIMLLQDL